MSPISGAFLQVTAVHTRPPEWAGWLSLAALIIFLSLVAWWLFASPLREAIEVTAPTRDLLRVRYRMALVVLGSFVLLRLGASWDELWHRQYGVPFGEDLLWPPHLLHVRLLSAERGHGWLRTDGGAAGTRQPASAVPT
jgi:hypothetical protein